VCREVVHHRPEALSQEIVQFTRTQIALPEDVEFMTLLRAFALGIGEQEVLALMRQQPTAILLTDDAAARLVAEQMGMRVHGTIGILLRALRRSLRTPEQVLSLLHLLPRQSTLYIRPTLLNVIIARVKREFDLN
jgi:predicted nucleic acid-binding protein